MIAIVALLLLAAAVGCWIITDESLQDDTRPFGPLPFDATDRRSA